MKRLIATVGMPRQQWLQVRRTGVCGSDASIILGINKYKSSSILDTNEEYFEKSVRDEYIEIVDEIIDNEENKGIKR